MKKAFLIVYIGTLFSLGCSRQTNLFYHDNTFIEEEIENIEGCKGLSEAIRNNFFFNKKDSLYIENYGFFVHGLMNEYYDCIKKMNTKQIIALFGIPHFEIDNTLYYITKNNGSFNNIRDGRTFYLRQDDNQLRLGQGGYNHPDSTFNISSTVNNPNLRRATDLKRKENYKLSSSKNINSNCNRRKENLEEEVFYHKKEKHYIVNSLIFQFIYDSGYDIPCDESFTIEEITGLFGKPSFVNGNKLYFHLYNKPFVSIEEKNTDKNGMIYCICFEKQDTGFYKLSTDMIKYSKIYNKNN